MKKLQRIIFLISRAWKMGRKYMLLNIIRNLFRGLLPIVNIVGMGMVIAALENGEEHERVMTLIVIYLSANFFIAIIRELLQLFERLEMRKTSDRHQIELSGDSVNVNYHYAQDGTLLSLRRKGMGVFPAFYLDSFGEILFFAVQFIGVIFIFSLLTPLFILLLALMTAASTTLIFKTRKMEFNFQNERVEEDRKLDYLYKVMTEYRFAKEVRINSAEKFVEKKYNGILNSQVNKLKNLYKKSEKINFASTFITVAQTGMMLFYFSYQVFTGQITIAQYTVLIGATALFTSLLLGFFDRIARINNTCKAIDFFNEYTDMLKNNSDIAASNILAAQEIDFSNTVIRFENVTFSYPGFEKVILKNINLEIKTGVKIGIVGLNGSGKTTLIKLLTRLYDPTEGRITINGLDIREIPHSQYVKQIGIVLQDFLLFAYSVKENVVLDREYDELRFSSSIAQSGLSSKINSLNKGIETSVYKTLDNEGIEFSGGEGQKLALARAIYKDADIFILDEPTSALDPFAEHELFSKLSDISAGKATVFISHRLSSTKICDNILVLADGEIIEHGNHEELMQHNGYYADLYNAQAQYYTQTTSKVKHF